ncbi:MAG: TMEM175 family protein [Opitutales bacterium]
MKTTRLEAFSDGVIAIIITIMVLELKVPPEHTLAGLWGMWPLVLSYALSFLNVAIYWVNHHHLIHLVRRVSAPVMWANLNQLFWLSLMPFSTAYLGENRASGQAVAVYGTVSALCAVGYYLLRHAVSCQTHDDPRLCALHDCMLRKNRIAIGIYLLAVGMAWLSPWLALALILAPAVMYFIPDREVERLLGE